MKSIKMFALISALVAFVLVSGCANERDPDVTKTRYLGSQACTPCHQEIYDGFIESGHPYKLNKVDGAAPTYPAFTPGVANPPTGYTWADISYVIGGYGWKARFIGTDGYIITGLTVQYNLADSTWSAYQDGVTVPYDCGACHTTGWSTTGNQDGMAGMSGTFELAGVQCEACHGAGSDHVDLGEKAYITKDSSALACGACHYRTTKDSLILASGGLIRHHEQYNEFMASPHSAELTCVTCHDPHKTIKYNSQTNYEALRYTCTSCHQVTSYHKDTSVTCVDCHMPKLVKSAIVTQAATGNAPDVGDIKSHIMEIDITQGAGTQFYTSGPDTYSNTYLTLEYVCLRCHTSQTVAWAQSAAANIHTAP